MMRSKKGFTVIEVTLFLALSGVLITGLIVGTNVSISRQRYNDSVKTIGEYLRGVYSDVLNVSNDKEVLPDDCPTGNCSYIGPGRTGTAIYGKLIVIGEPEIDPSTIYSYDVVGNTISPSKISKTNTKSILGDLNADIFETSAVSGQNLPFKSAYTVIPWEGRLEKTENDNLFRAVILIVRSPLSGTIHTYYKTYNETDMPRITRAVNDGGNNRLNFSNLLSEVVENTIDMCVQSPDNNYGVRRNIRINTPGVNSSAVELVAQDNKDDNKCI